MNFTDKAMALVVKISYYVEDEQPGFTRLTLLNDADLSQAIRTRFPEQDFKVT